MALNPRHHTLLKFFHNTVMRCVVTSFRPVYFLFDMLFSFFPNGRRAAEAIDNDNRDDWTVRWSPSGAHELGYV